MVITAALAFAALNTALAQTWNLGTGLANGYWTEDFHGNGPGQPGNTLSGASFSGPGLQWSLSGFNLVSAVPKAGGAPNEYISDYTGGTIVFKGVTYSGLTAINDSISGDPSQPLWFDMTITGLGITADGVFTANSDNYTLGLPNQQGGRWFDSLDITVTAPDGGSTAGLLGVGFLGLAGLRRRFVRS